MISEYQYYEFQAIDRPLTEKEMDDLGEEPNLGLCSTRLPCVDRGSRDTLCNGKILLPEAAQDALPAEVFAPGLRVTWRDAMLGFSRS